MYTNSIKCSSCFQYSELCEKRNWSRWSCTFFYKHNEVTCNKKLQATIMQSGEFDYTSISNASVSVITHHIAFLALWCPITVVELHSLQGAVACNAAETVWVEKFVHCPDCRLRPGQSLSTLSTHLCLHKQGQGKPKEKIIQSIKTMNVEIPLKHHY